MRGGSSGRWHVERALSDWLRGSHFQLGCVRCDGFGAPDIPRASQSLTRSWPAAAPAPQWKKMVALRRRTNARARQSRIFSTTDARRCTQTQLLICVHLCASVVDFPCSPTGRPNVGVYFHGRKHEDHGGPRRRKIWRFARSAFTRFGPDIYFVGFYCPELITPRQSSGYGAVFAGFLRGPPRASCFLRVKDLLACSRVRTCPGRWISWPGRGSHTRPGSHTQPGATAGTGACRRAAA
jgi:hypothetical protein